MRRFERIHDVVEPVEEYRRGGYHPVHLHDVFHQRCEVIAKQAYGQFSTVWLAKDINSSHRQVALKILKADMSQDNEELATLSHLSASELAHPGKAHVVELLDHFYHPGPNGTHLCLVLPVMIFDGQTMILSDISHKAGYVQTISRQVLLGLDFLHQSDIVHCDLQPANILISVPEDTPYDQHLQAPQFSPVKWLPGVTPDNSAPEYLMPTQRPHGQLAKAPFPSLVVRIGDLGGAQRGGQYNQRPVTPIALRAPELIYHGSWDSSIDIWTLGCLIFEFATNEPLFPLDAFGLTREEIDQDHEALIRQIIGAQGQSNNDQLKFPAYLADRLPEDFGGANVQALASFLGLMLRISPRERASAGDLLCDRFVEGESFVSE